MNGDAPTDEAPIYHPTTRDPRECGAPPPLTPPRHGTRDASTALVVARWMLAADDKFRFRGMRVRFLGVGWHG